MNSYWDRGLLGIAVDADFATNRFVYLLYVHEANALDPSGPKTSRLTRIRVTSDNELEDPDAPETILLGLGRAGPVPGARRHRRLHPRRRLLARDRDRAGRPRRHAVARIG